MLTELAESTKTDRELTSGLAGCILEWLVDIPQGGNIGTLQDGVQLSHNKKDFLQLY